MTSDSRFSRQTVLPQVGAEGQVKLSRARVLCIGAGGLGSPAALYLAAAGIGTVGIIDDDRVSLSNLQRQVLFTTEEVGSLKAERARSRLLALYPGIHVEAYPERLSPEGAESLISRYDVVIDGSDNFETKFLANDVCVKLGIPLVYGSVLQFDGQVAVFDSRHGACYRCLFRKPPEHAIPNCAEAGVLGAVCGWVGSTQALEAVKLVLDHPTLPPLRSRLAVFDGVNLSLSVARIPKRPECPACSQPSVEVRGEVAGGSGISAADLAQALRGANPPRLIDVREAAELEDGWIPGAENWPYSRIRNRDLPSLPCDARIVLYCRSGSRSAAALPALRGAGAHGAVHLRGGFAAWNGPVAPAVDS